MRRGWLVIALGFIALSGCGGRAAPGRSIVDGGGAGVDMPAVKPGTPCTSDCDCPGMACVGNTCMIANRQNGCCTSRSTEDECNAQAICEWSACPACNGVSSGFCNDRGQGVTCAGLCAAPQCQGLDETTCTNTPGCQATSCPGCNGAAGFAGCIRTGDPGPQCPAPFCPPNCAQLDQMHCSTQQGCSPLFCADCNGNMLYSGCDFDGMPDGCAVPFCPPSGCASNADCQPGEACQTPGEAGCVGCFNPEVPCMVDADCGQSGIVCTTVQCSCIPGTFCQPGCMSDAACQPGEQCGSDFHCHPASCGGGGCPPLFDCALEADCLDGIPCCHRRSCNSDGDCHVKNAPMQGSCVDNQCYDSPGQCVPPPPP